METEQLPFYPTPPLLYTQPDFCFCTILRLPVMWLHMLVEDLIVLFDSFVLKTTSEACGYYPPSTNEKSLWKTSLPLPLLAQTRHGLQRKASSESSRFLLSAGPLSLGGSTASFLSSILERTLSVYLFPPNTPHWSVSILSITPHLGHASSSWNKQIKEHTLLFSGICRSYVALLNSKAL